jgi:hypothetical protein
VGPDDKFQVFQAVVALFEAHSKPRPSPAALNLYWAAVANVSIEHFEAAIARAARELKWPARPAELREFARDARNGGPAQAATIYRCHFHGDGEYEHPPVGKPDHPSRNPTMWWCDRCMYFVKMGLQQPPDPVRRPETVAETIRHIASAYEDPK